MLKFIQSFLVSISQYNLTQTQTQIRRTKIRRNTKMLRHGASADGCKILFAALIPFFGGVLIARVLQQQGLVEA